VAQKFCNLKLVVMAQVKYVKVKHTSYYVLENLVKVAWKQVLQKYIKLGNLLSLCETFSHWRICCQSLPMSMAEAAWEEEAQALGANNGGTNIKYMGIDVCDSA